MESCRSILSMSAVGFVIIAFFKTRKTFDGFPKYSTKESRMDSKDSVILSLNCCVLMAM